MESKKVKDHTLDIKINDTDFEIILERYGLQYIGIVSNKYLESSSITKTMMKELLEGIINDTVGYNIKEEDNDVIFIIEYEFNKKLKKVLITLFQTTKTPSKETDKKDTTEYIINSLCNKSMYIWTDSDALDITTIHTYLLNTDKEYLKSISKDKKYDGSELATLVTNYVFRDCMDELKTLQQYQQHLYRDGAVGSSKRGLERIINEEQKYQRHLDLDGAVGDSKRGLRRLINAEQQYQRHLDIDGAFGSSKRGLGRLVNEERNVQLTLFSQNRWWNLALELYLNIMLQSKLVLDDSTDKLPLQEPRPGKMGYYIYSCKFIFRSTNFDVNKIKCVVHQDASKKFSIMLDGFPSHNRNESTSPPTFISYEER